MKPQLLLLLVSMVACSTPQQHRARDGAAASPPAATADGPAVASPAPVDAPARMVAIDAPARPDAGAGATRDAPLTMDGSAERPRDAAAQPDAATGDGPRIPPGPVADGGYWSVVNPRCSHAVLHLPFVAHTVPGLAELSAQFMCPGHDVRPPSDCNEYCVCWFKGCWKFTADDGKCASATVDVYTDVPECLAACNRIGVAKINPLNRVTDNGFHCPEAMPCKGGELDGFGRCPAASYGP